MLSSVEAHSEHEKNIGNSVDTCRGIVQDFDEQEIAKMVVQTKKLMKLIDCNKGLNKHKMKADLLLKEIQQIQLELEQLQN